MSRKKIAIILPLIVAGIVGRLTLSKLLPPSPDIYINVKGITQPLFMMDLFFVIATVSMLSGFLLDKRFSMVVPVSVMLLTDLIIGNNLIFIFTWSGFAMIALLSYILKSRKGFNLQSKYLLLGTGIAGVLLYDLWTNFGCWLLWYPHTVEGLILCYTLAIPFTLWHLLSTTLSVTFIILPIAYLKETKTIRFLLNPERKPDTVIADN
ncbi:MAG: hypothetical protein FE037_01270 [Thermoplasmata archaeon]|nr:MAG: hypothetical protein FE042_00290 [Thermoplasmata archaeon]KAA0016732.1 MAG: hypothetical protein FE037_01270 [Thermoplasmata archaeon]